MSNENQDLKLKNLIQVCKETHNFKKLAVVSFILISNRLNEIGINLGTRKRNKESGETLVEYMESVNHIFQKDLGILIFRDYFIETLSECEPLFLRERGNLPYDDIRTMYQVYYELRRLDIPNLHRQINDSDLVGVSNYSFQSFLSPSSKRKHNSGSDILKPLILQKLKEKQIALQKQSKENPTSLLLEKVISLKKVQNTLDSKKKKSKIRFEGTLKENINYQQSIENVVGYFILGLVILLFTLGISITMRVVLYSELLVSLSNWALLFVGGGSILFIVYYTYFIKRR